VPAATAEAPADVVTNLVILENGGHEVNRFDEDPAPSAPWETRLDPGVH
jgi:hypothetical protein